jgi:fructokinase
MNFGSRSYFCIGLGEVLWDLLPGGRQLGGAPANFAYHAHALGAESLVVSRVGRDDLGRDLVEHLNALGLVTSGISVDPAAPTGTVSVTLDPTGQPTYTIHTDVAWDFLEAGPEVLRAAAGADAVCFGTLAQRHPVARDSIRRVLQATRTEALRIFDINLRQRFWSRDVIVESLALANVLKLNDEELPILMDLLGWPCEDDQGLMARLAQRFDLRAVALTRGARGSLLWTSDRSWNWPGSDLKVADTVGAGDSYTAALALGLLSGKSPEDILRIAHRVADFVCTQPGATPPMPADFAAEFVGTRRTEGDPSGNRS